MSNSSIGMGEQDQAEREKFLNELQRIFKTSEKVGATLRVIGSLANLLVDVFYEKLDFSHVISWSDRLEVDSPTIPLAELLLEKMQIFQINEKDIIDTIMLLLEHPLGDSDEEVINIDRIARFLAKDWGLWRTTTMNLDKVKQMAGHYSQLNDDEQAQVAIQVDKSLASIEAEPKSRGWKLRARIGDRVKWYKDVDEVS